MVIPSIAVDRRRCPNLRHPHPEPQPTVHDKGRFVQVFSVRIYMSFVSVTTERQHTSLCRGHSGMFVTASNARHRENAHTIKHLV